MMRLALLLVLCLAAPATEEYLGYLGRWVEVEATAYSPHDSRDSAYHATKGKDRWKTAGRVSDVRRVPYGIAAPQPYHRPVLPTFLVIPLRTRVIVPLGNGYLDHERDTPEERVFLVDDTGSDIVRETRRTGRLNIDLRMKTEADALAYGRKRFRVFIIERDVPKLPPPLPPHPQPQAPPPPPEPVGEVQRSFAAPLEVVLAPPTHRVVTKHQPGDPIVETFALLFAALVLVGWALLLRSRA